MDIRALTPAYASQLARIHGLCFDKAWSADFFKDQLQGRSLAIGAFDQEVLVSFVLCQLIQGEGEILTLCTHPAYRGCGFAAGILDCLLQHQELQVCFLEVRADNTAAKSLYLSRGFQEKDVRKAYYSVAGASSCDGIIYCFYKK